MIIDYAIGKVLFIAFLCVCALLDYKYRSIDIRIFWIMLLGETAFILILVILERNLDIPSMLSGVLLGVLLFILSRLTRGSIGQGDAWFFALSGLAIGGARNICVFAASILMCAVIGIGLNMNAPARGRKIALLPIVLPFGVIMTLAV